MVMTGDLGTAEDVVQDAFERVHKRWHQIRDPARVVAYARAAVLNGCRSALRKSAVARRNASQLAVFAGPAGPQAHDPAAAADARSELIAALRRLPRRQLEVLVLRYYLDLDPPEIAHILRIRPSSVRATATRGLAGLARSLGQELE